MSDSALKGGAVFEGEGQATICVGRGVLLIAIFSGLNLRRSSLTSFLFMLKSFFQSNWGVL